MLVQLVLLFWRHVVPFAVTVRRSNAPQVLDTKVFPKSIVVFQVEVLNILDFDPFELSDIALCNRFVLKHRFDQRVGRLIGVLFRRAQHLVKELILVAC